MEELFCIAGDREVILGEIGTIRGCIDNNIPYNKIDVDVGDWISNFVAGKSDINFQDDETELNGMIFSLRSKATELQKEMDVIKEKLKILVDFPSYLGIIEFIERMNNHVKVVLGKINTRAVDSKRNQLETARMLQYGWKCFVKDKKYAMREAFGTESSFEESDGDDNLLLSTIGSSLLDGKSTAGNSPLDGKSTAGNSPLDEKNNKENDDGFFLDEKTGLFTGLSKMEVKNGSAFIDDPGFVNGPAFLDEKSGLIMNRSSVLAVNESSVVQDSMSAYSYLDETSGMMTVGMNLSMINKTGAEKKKYPYLDDESGVMIDIDEDSYVMMDKELDEEPGIMNVKNDQISRFNLESTGTHDNVRIPALMDMVAKLPAGFVCGSIKKKKKKKKSKKVKRVKGD